MQKWDDINLDSDEIHGISENCVIQTKNWFLNYYYMLLNP
jgi:hypothetical protein